MEVLIDDAPVIAAAGMDFEARIALGPGVRAVFGQKRDKYLQDLHALVRRGARGIVSFGTAGGISPALKPGDVVVASAVVTAKARFETHSPWSKSMLNANSHAHYMPVFGVEAPVLSVLEKEALWSATGVAAIDVESRAAAEVAAHYGLPFAVLRVIIDPAHRAIPLSALAGVREDGTVNAFSVFRSLLRRPEDIGGIFRLAGDSRKANRALLRCRQSLGPFFGLLDSLKLPLNVE
jgi:hopanoid-associated phosphorylase